MRPLEDTRIFVIEDEPLISLSLCDMLTDMGGIISAQVSNLGRGLELSADIDVDLAVLDVNLNGQRSFPIADMFEARGIPYFFTTGYDTEVDLNGFFLAPVVKKPYGRSDLERAAKKALKRG